MEMARFNSWISTSVIKNFGIANRFLTEKKIHVFITSEKTGLDPSQPKVIIPWFLWEGKFITNKCCREGGVADPWLPTQHATPRKDIFYRQPWITKMISLTKNPRSHHKLKQRYKHTKNTSSSPNG